MSEKHNLVKAIKTNNWKKVKTLLENYPKLLTMKLTNSGSFWYHAMSIYTADTKETEDIILELCTKYEKFVDLEKELMANGSFTPLMLATWNGKFHQTRAFLKLGSKDIAIAKHLCCSYYGSNKKNKTRILKLLRNPPAKYVPHTNIHYNFNKLELCDDEPDEPVGDD